jgi:hypothetical protein
LCCSPRSFFRSYNSSRWSSKEFSGYPGAPRLPCRRRGAARPPRTPRP